MNRYARCWHLSESDDAICMILCTMLLALVRIEWCNVYDLVYHLESCEQVRSLLALHVFRWCIQMMHSDDAFRWCIQMRPWRPARKWAVMMKSMWKLAVVTCDWFAGFCASMANGMMLISGTFYCCSLQLLRSSMSGWTACVPGSAASLCDAKPNSVQTSSLKGFFWLLSHLVSQKLHRRSSGEGLGCCCMMITTTRT